jgi:hypothetical protein
VHPHDADTIYVVPLATMTRTGPDGVPAGFILLRDAMDVDRLKAPALCVGTTTGQLWIGRDGGES